MLARQLLRRLGWLLPLVGFALPHAASACTPAVPAIFADDFKDDGGGWDLSGGRLKFGPDGLTATIPPGAVVIQALNLTFDIRDASLCLASVMPASRDPLPSQGIIFWARDYQSFYMAQTGTNRKVYVYRRVNAVWTKLYDAEVPGLKTEAGAINELGVELREGTVTVSVNGVQVRRFRGLPPEGASRFGVYAQIADPVKSDTGVVFAFKNFAVNPLK